MEDAIAELTQSNKIYFTLKELEKWLAKYKVLYKETMVYSLKKNDCDLFWTLFISIGDLIKHYKQLPLIKKCIYNFKNLDKKNENSIYDFLLKNEPLLSDFNISSSSIALDKNLKIHQQFEIYVKAPYQVDFQYLNQNINIPIKHFYVIKKNYSLNKDQLINYIKELELVSKWETS